MMICEACRTAADENKQGEAAHKAAGCPGPRSCACMHRSGTPEELYNQERLGNK